MLGRKRREQTKCELKGKETNQEAKEEGEEQKQREERELTDGEERATTGVGDHHRKRMTMRRKMEQRQWGMKTETKRKRGARTKHCGIVVVEVVMREEEDAAVFLSVLLLPLKKKQSRKLQLRALTDLQKSGQEEEEGGTPWSCPE